MICVTPVAIDTRSSTGREKNMRQVGQNGALRGRGAAPARGASRPPRTGSRTNSSTTSAVTMPDRAQGDEGGAPAVGRGDRRAERDAQRLPDRRPEVEQAQRRAARPGGK